MYVLAYLQVAFFNESWRKLIELEKFLSKKKVLWVIFDWSGIFSKKGEVCCGATNHQPWLKGLSIHLKTI